MIGLDDLRGRLTVNVPEAAKLLGLGRDTAYAMAECGDLPSIRVGRRVVCPTHAVLRLAGLPDELIAGVLGIAPECTDGEPATGSPTATVHALTKSTGGPQHGPTHAA